ncbi:MAG: RNA polymerase sigma factor [Myxococcota bacterium]
MNAPVHIHPAEQLAEWFGRERESLIRLVYQLTGCSHDDAEDIVQGALFRATAGLAGFKGQAALSTWATRILIRECTRYRRRGALWRRLHHLLTVPAASPSPDVLLRQTLLRALDRLTPPQREVFVLVRMNGMPLSEAAESMGCAEGTAKSHLHRSLERLRRTLKSSYGELG